MLAWVKRDARSHSSSVCTFCVHARAHCELVCTVNLYILHYTLFCVLFVKSAALIYDT